MASKLIVNEIEHTDGSSAVTMAKATIADATLTSATIADATLTSATLGTVTAGNLANSAIVYPSGHVTNMFSFTKQDVSGEYGEYTHWETTTTISQKAIGFSAIDTRKYHVFSTMSHWPYIASGNTTAGYGDIKLWWGVTARAQGAVQTGDNLITTARTGRAFPSSQGRHGYFVSTLQGTFTAASTATHYVYQTGKGATGYTYFRAVAIAQAPWNVIIFETMP